MRFWIYSALILSLIVNFIFTYEKFSKQEPKKEPVYSDNPTIEEINQMPDEVRDKAIAKKLDQKNKELESELEKGKKELKSQIETNSESLKKDESPAIVTNTPVLTDSSLKEGFVIVVGAFKTAHFVDKNETKLKELGYSVIKEERLINKQKLTVLMVGLFKDQAMAKITMDVLKEDKQISDKSFLKKIQL